MMSMMGVKHELEVHIDGQYTNLNGIWQAWIIKFQQRAWRGGDTLAEGVGNAIRWIAPCKIENVVRVHLIWLSDKLRI